MRNVLKRSKFIGNWERITRVAIAAAAGVLCVVKTILVPIYGPLGYVNGVVDIAQKRFQKNNLKKFPFDDSSTDVLVVTR
jgi:hypothetical protein